MSRIIGDRWCGWPRVVKLIATRICNCKISLSLLSQNARKCRQLLNLAIQICNLRGNIHKLYFPSHQVFYTVRLWFVIVGLRLPNISARHVLSYMRRCWCSGNIYGSQPYAPGSIPGRRILIGSRTSHFTLTYNWDGALFGDLWLVIPLFR